MSVNEGQIGIGVVVAVRDGVGPSYVDMPDVQMIDFPELPMQKAKKTVVTSTTEEYGPTIIDPDEMTITQLFDEDEFERNTALKGDAQFWRITFNDGQIFTLPGFVVSVKQNFALVEYLQMDTKVQITGDAVIT